jgi:hypothetical protein
MQESFCQLTPPKKMTRKELAGRFMSEEFSCAESLESPTSTTWKRYEQAAVSHLQQTQKSVITITQQDYCQNSLGCSLTGEFHQNKLRKLLPKRKQSSTESADKEPQLLIPRAVASQTGTAC